MSRWAGQGARKRIADPEYAAEPDRLDEGVAERVAEMTDAERMGQFTRF
jgi:hypothetical protein